MTSVMRMKSATVGKDHVISAGEQSDEQTDDSLLLSKPRKQTQVSECESVILHEVTNMNNNRPLELESNRRTFHSRKVPTHDIPHNQNTIPVPMAWSPGVTFKSNPLLMITPEKPFLSLTEPSLIMKENILEPQSANKIPKPVAWTPRMKIQPDVNLFITPEKDVGNKIVSNSSKDDRNTIVKSCVNNPNNPVKAKNVYSVRFDIPYSTSEDESRELLSEIGSPITIRGCDMDISDFDSPFSKSSNSPKAYNPGMYSDESLLDESIISSEAKTNSDQSSNKQTSCVTKSNSDNSRNKSHVHLDLPDCTSREPYRESNSLKTGKHFPESGTKDMKLSVSSRIKPKSNTSVNTRSKVPDEKKKLSVEKLLAEAEHHSLPMSSTESPPQSWAVIREAKDPLMPTKYSFPFQQAVVAAEDCEYEHVFARPEFNSTLAMREKLDTLSQQKVDVMKAVHATLATSEVKTSELNEKAAVYTNRTSVQFRNLIDLNTSVESLCDRVVRMRTSKVPSKRRTTHIQKKSSETQRAPDLMEFFTPDLQKENPDVTLLGVTPVTSHLMTAPPELAFDLYRHSRLWQGISDL